MPWTSNAQILSAISSVYEDGLPNVGISLGMAFFLDAGFRAGFFAAGLVVALVVGFFLGVGFFTGGDGVCSVVMVSSLRE